MECNRCNQDTRYSNRNGRNMVGSGMNYGRCNDHGMMQNRNACGNMNQARNTCGNMNQARNTCGNMNQARNTCSNMNQTKNSCERMNQNRNSERNMEQNNRSFRENRNEERECGCKDAMNTKKRDEGCDRGNEPVDKMMPTMCYVPWQQWEDIYCMEEGFERGTMFAGLDKPFVGRSAK